MYQNKSADYVRILEICVGVYINSEREKDFAAWFPWKGPTNNWSLQQV